VRLLRCNLKKVNFDKFNSLLEGQYNNPTTQDAVLYLKERVERFNNAIMGVTDESAPLTSE